MAHTEYCPDKNEFFVSGIGCVCRDNKICEYNASRKIFLLVENSWALGMLVLATLGLAVYAVHTLRTFRNLLITKKKATTTFTSSSSSSLGQTSGF